MFFTILFTAIFDFIILEFIFTVIRLIFNRWLKFHLLSIFLDFLLIILMTLFWYLWSQFDDMTTLYWLVLSLFIFFLLPLIWIKFKEKFFIKKWFNLSFYYYLQEFVIYYVWPLLIFWLIWFIWILLGKF
jgi:hypothetical protein